MSGTVAEVEQLQGLGIFAADIREELIGKILKPLIELEELAGGPEANPSLTRYCKCADSLEEHFACAEYLVEEGRAFFRHGESGTAKEHSATRGQRLPRPVIALGL
jgi:hypothetical protein